MRSRDVASVNPELPAEAQEHLRNLCCRILSEKDPRNFSELIHELECLLEYFYPEAKKNPMLQ